MGRRLSIEAFNEITLIKQRGKEDTLSAKTYNYFEYKEEETYGLVDQVLALATRPFLTSSMGEYIFVYNVLGLTIEELMKMDLMTLEKIDKYMTELARQLKPKASGMPDPKEKN